MNVYEYVVLAVLAGGAILPQKGRKRKTYIIVMAAIHTFVCGFRYCYLTGDLQKYGWNFYDMVNRPWLSESVIAGGRNTLFFMFSKLISELTGDFQVFLFLIALIIEIGVAVLVYRYSPIPWMSYLVWNSIGFYIFGFSAIKQALAMGILLFAVGCILEDDLKGFLLFTAIAGFIHMPSFIFLPAYWIARSRINNLTVISYAFAGILVYLNQGRIVSFFSDSYYDDQMFIQHSSRIGGRFMIIVLMLFAGLIMKGFQEESFEKLFNLVVMAAFIQMFSNFDNVFTRLCDYYLQCTVLYIPLLFARGNSDEWLDYSRRPALVNFSRESKRIFIGLLTLILIWYYYRTSLSAQISNEVDNYLNFRFMWDVVQ